MDSKPTNNCQQGRECMEKSVFHFMVYSHDHLDKIIETNTKIGDSDEYQIPQDLLPQKDLILDQIQIINELLSKQSLEPNTKVNEPNSPNEQPSTSQSQNESIDFPFTYDETTDIADYIQVSVPKGQMAQKLAAARPYNYFLTCVTSSPETHTEPLLITFQEIFDPSLGELECSVQINFMINIDWLLGQYYFAGYLSKPLLILYGTGSVELEIISEMQPQVTAHKIKVREFASHHTKMMLLGYKDGSMRIVISTANLYGADWHNRTQGLWLSEKLEPLPAECDATAAESVTEFRKDLLHFLSNYQLADLEPWLHRISKTDFTTIKVFLVASVPGRHPVNENGCQYGHLRVAYLLHKHSAPINESSAIVAQSSSLGRFGKGPHDWLFGNFAKSFRQDSSGQLKQPNVRIIYPTYNNVVNSHDGLRGGGCLPYGNFIHRYQRWLKRFLFQWHADGRCRTKAMPHVKSYCRWSEKKLFWFILTSANLSKTAWGTLGKYPTLQMNNYEAGIIFLPKFLTNTSYFSMDESDHSTPIFPMLYDIPLTKYANSDEPFLCDTVDEEIDE